MTASPAGAARLYLLLALTTLPLTLLWQRLLDPIPAPQLFPMRFFQNVVGTLDGRKCGDYPVCSLYARQALRKHGLVIGSWLAMDRIIHEVGDLERGPFILYQGERRVYDPLARNDFWLDDR
ncbi:MAG: membrane protein insertion efficiency factor YidD [Zetaproteobacteria bacterium]|nr:MAG: membrane protein insertion efficiency factor YidD [Zetaproteobacteria bacterium]